MCAQLRLILSTALGLFLAAVLASGPARAADFARGPWLADLAQLRDAMTAGYANLEWQAGRSYDLQAAYRRAQSRLEAAHDEFAARSALERFLAGFGDGHLEINWPTPKAAAATRETQATQEPLCDRLGYFQLADEGGPALRLPGATPVGPADAHIKAATVPIGRRTLAVLRVGMFSPAGYPGICEAVARARGLTSASPCDEACQHGLQQAADIAFVGELAGQLRALAAIHPDALLVDISGNGGGNASLLALARMVTAKPLLRPRGGGLRGAAWAAELADRQAGVAKALKTAAPADRPSLRQFDLALGRARAEAGQTCDRSPLWRDEPIACSALVPEPLLKGFWSSIPEPDDPIVAARPIWTGPLLVLVDGDSASSSEWFAAMLQDSHAATVLGAPTFGAGCGHMTSAGPVKLANSGGEVSMPDCWRLRANGDNEVGGVEPDVLVAFREHDTLTQRIARLARALPRALASAKP